MVFSKTITPLFVTTILALALGFIAPQQGLADDGSTPGAAPSDPFGVYFWPDGDQVIGAAQLAETGANWANIHLHWSEVEATQGAYNWSHWDAVLQQLASQQYQIIVTLGGNPAWAAETHCGPIQADHLDEFAAFLTAAVARYSAPPYNVLYWALYNEPDNSDPVTYGWLGGCWGKASPNHVAGAGGAAYANMLSVAYPAIKAGNPSAQALLGGMAYEWWEFMGGPFDSQFLDDLLAAGGANYFDAINFHYYPAWAAIWSTGDRYTSNIYGKAKYLHDQVQAKSGQSKPVVCTEVGYPTAGPDGDALPYSEELSAQYVLKVFTRAMAYGIGPVIWLQGVDTAWQAHAYGLLDTELKPKENYYVYRTLTRELAHATFLTSRRDFPLDVEGYDFNVDGRTKTVLWRLGANDVRQQFSLAENGGTLRVVEKEGSLVWIVDGSAVDLDGMRNGQVEIQVNASPRIVEDATHLPACAMYELTGDNVIDLDDILVVLYKSLFVGAPYDSSFDFNSDLFIDISDIFAVVVYFGESCSSS